MKTLQVTQSTFTAMLSGLIQSGVTFEAKQYGAEILITFTGGF
jgi:hypothetical protein